MTKDLCWGWGSENIFKPHPYTRIFIDPHPYTKKFYCMGEGKKIILDPHAPS